MKNNFQLMKYSETEAKQLLSELSKKEENLRFSQNKIALLRRNLNELKDQQVQEKHPDGQPKLDEKRRPILSIKKPIDAKLGIEITDERRDAIFTKIIQDSKNL